MTAASGANGSTVFFLTAADLELAALLGRCVLSTRDAAELGLDPAAALKSGIDREAGLLAVMLSGCAGAAGCTVDDDGRAVAAEDGREGGLAAVGSCLFELCSTFRIMGEFSFSC